ncbi:MAG: energy transducer TonB [Bryobacteraceae bacterium]|nr:energy transducer TonB [Bryobacteraceae bacterium]
MLVRYMCLAFSLAQLSISELATVRVGTKVFRGQCINCPLPEYPSQSAAAKVVGTFVARITVGSSGEVRVVEILQSPDIYISNSAKAMITTWRFRPLGIENSEARPYKGKVLLSYEMGQLGPQVRDLVK